MSRTISSEYPLVSAIMPTRGRRQLAARALKCFLAQTWPNKELIIVDDADDPSFDSELPASCKRFVLPTRMKIGAKRNFAVRKAAGNIIVHFDSDDESTPDRIEDQARRLIGAPQQLTGYNRIFFTNGHEYWEFHAPPGYVAGTTLMYRRSAWIARPFRDIQVGEDSIFMAKRGLIAADGRDKVLAWIHPNNTSDKRTLQKRPPSKQWVYLGKIGKFWENMGKCQPSIVENECLQKP